jgi:hypothetical protein
MNSKKMIISIIVFFTIIIIVFSGVVKADGTFNSTPMAFMPGTQFSNPTTNCTVSFSQSGYYGNYTLVNGTWVFTGLQLDSSTTDALSDNPNTANLNITTSDSNITIGSFERLLTPDPNDVQNTGIWLTSGWLNYTVTGQGTQAIRMEFNLANWTSPAQNETNGISMWPINVNVYVDGNLAPFNTNWTNVDDIGMIPFGTGIIVSGATSNVSINYAWVPVPEPVGVSSSSTHITGLPSQNPLILYLAIAAVATLIIVPTAIFINRHRLAQFVHSKKADSAPTLDALDERKKE